MAVIGLISTAPFARAQGVPATSRITSFRSVVSIIEKPASGTLELAKAPFVVVGLPPGARTVVAVGSTGAMRGDCREETHVTLKTYDAHGARRYRVLDLVGARKGRY